MATHVVNLWPFMVPECSLPCPQEPATGHCSASDELICTLPQHFFMVWRYPCICACVLQCFLSFRLCERTFLSIYNSPTSATCHAHQFQHYIILIYGERKAFPKWFCPASCNFFLGPNILLSPRFWLAFSIPRLRSSTYLSWGRTARPSETHPESL